MEKKRVYAYEVEREGGPWLGALRTRIQSVFRNGEHVTWGSNDVVSHAPTVKELEEMCAWAVAADRNDAENREKQAEWKEKREAMFSNLNP